MTHSACVPKKRSLGLYGLMSQTSCTFPNIVIVVMTLDGSVPVKYGVRLNMDEKYKVLKKALSELTDIPTNQILLVEILGPVVKVSTQ